MARPVSHIVPGLIAALRPAALALAAGAGGLGLAAAWRPGIARLPLTLAASAAAAAAIALLLALLRQRDRLLATLAAHGRDAVARLDPYGRIAEMSAASRLVLGAAPAALIGQPLMALCHPEDAAMLAGLLAARPPPSGAVERPIRLRRADGNFQPTELVFAADPPGGLICALRDVTRWQAAVAAARESEHNHQTIAALAGDMIVRVRPDRTRAYVSPSAERVLGHPVATLYDIDFVDLVHPEDRSRVSAAFGALVQDGGQTTCRFRMNHRTRGYIAVEAIWTTQAGDSDGGWREAVGREVVAIVRDISERVAAEERTAFLARHDPLTGLANRAFLRERAEQALAVRAEAGGVAILCIDLDLFKAVNDSLGHAAGDLLLCEVTRRIGACVRHTDTVARLGGDEFAILQHDLEAPQDATRLAARVLSALATPFAIDGETVPISASLGIAVAPAHGTDYATLLRRADAAMYRAKAQGRGRWQMFEPAMEQRRAARDRTVLDLRQALARGEFVLHYLPFVALDDGRILGFEALLRWRHPERGLLKPGAFLPLAEETGLMAPIGAWVLHQACAEAARWPAPLAIAVNLSAVQLRGNRLAQRVGAVLAATGLAGDRLEIEIAAPLLLEEERDIVGELHRVRAMGARLALDDFGTSHGSLRHLGRFPVDKIKLDRALVRDLVHNPNRRAIARAVAGLGRSLGIETVAVGVELPTQRDLLRADGFSQAQGFLFARPAPAEVIHAPLPTAALETAA